MATSWLAPDGWRERQDAAIREVLGARVDWSEYLRLVDYHRTPALSWAALKRVPGADVAQTARQGLQERSQACQMQAVRHGLLLADVLKGFQSEGIPVMLMKGPALSYEMYGDIGLRHSKDLDAMVAPMDIPRARACLEAMGWVPDAKSFALTARQWEAAMRHDHHTLYVHPKRRCSLELHWRNQWDSEEHAARRWERSIEAQWQGAPYRAMSPVDQVLYLCSHGSDHAWFRAKWLGDLARLHAASQVDWEVCLAEAQVTDQERPVRLCLELLQEAYGLPLPAVAERGKRLPAFLVERSVFELKASREPELLAPMQRVQRQFHMTRYMRLLRPQTSWGKRFSDLCYSEVDFRVLSLPDKLFWAYVPLRPFLWAWRRLIRGRLGEPAGK